jgi:hypothetical protein
MLKARQAKAKHNTTWKDKIKSRQDKTRQDKTRQDKVDEFRDLPLIIVVSHIFD